MKRSILLVPLTALIVWAQAGVFDQTDSILAELSAITGMRVLRPVKQDIMSRDQLKGYFEERIKEVVKPEEIRIEELVLRKFGFVPEGFDLKKTTVDLMTEQAAAFYDYRGKRMVLLKGDNDPMQQAALVHELAHALADQHFQLEKFLGKAGDSDDSSMARTAVMEGQATWLMSEYLAKRMGGSLIDSPQLLDKLSQLTAGAGGDATFPVLKSVPLYMRESLVFPYTKGMQFQHEVAVRLGKSGFTQVYRRSPQTTHEIIHPEAYFDGFKPATPAMPEPQGTGWKKVAEGTLGEFDVGILLEQYAFTEWSAARAWRGGRYRLWEHRVSKRAVLGWSVEFAREDAARDYFTAYRKVMTKKWTQCRFTVEEPSRMEGEGDDGKFTVRRDGLVVTGLEGT